MVTKEVDLTTTGAAPEGGGLLVSTPSSEESSWLPRSLQPLVCFGAGDLCSSPTRRPDICSSEGSRKSLVGSGRAEPTLLLLQGKVPHR